MSHICWRKLHFLCSVSCTEISILENNIFFVRENSIVKWAFQAENLLGHGMVAVTPANTYIHVSGGWIFLNVWVS